jgi:hypothetical protein
MVEQGRGSIINISSICGVLANDPNLYVGTDMKQPPTWTNTNGSNGRSFETSRR